MDNITKMAAWLRAERQQRGWSAEEVASRARTFAEQAGDPIKLKQQSVSAFEQGQAKRLPSWLQYVKRAFDEGDQGSRVADDDAVSIAELPTYAGAGGGGTGEGESGSVSFSRGLVERELRAKPDDLLAVVIEGNSMSPDFQSGDRLLVDKRKLSLAQPGAFCFWDGDGYVVKYVERVPGSEPARIRVISRNQTFSTFERLVEEVRILGRVVWFARRV